MIMLKGLYLGKCNAGSEGVKHLVKGRWPNIEELSLRKNFEMMLRW
jgi:hypothetical protein